MDTTEGALGWLLSLSAACTSSPTPFTDWLWSSSPFPDADDADDLSPPLAAPPPVLFPSPAPAVSPFGGYLDLFDPSLALPSLSFSFSDVSPVVRASRNADDPDKENQPPNHRKRKSRSRISKNTSSSSFLEKLQSAPSILPTIQHPAAPHLPANLDLLDDSHLVLLSPVKLPSHRAPSPLNISPEPSIIPAPVFTTPPRQTNAFLSPLSPLTPLSSPDHSPLKIKIILKRKIADPTTPLRRTKRPRRTRSLAVIVDPSSPVTDIDSPPTSAHEEEQPQDEIPRSVYTNRTLPTDIEISSAFPLLYRRFPASTYYQPPDEDSPCTLFKVPHPGGNYNPPRRVFDLYTPRFVRGRGAEKVGLCPVCIEPVVRGGENRRLWLAMKFSAFKCYHMQYAHGISAPTGKPFSPPTAFRVVRRQNAGKNEKVRIQEGKCHKCSKWVAVEGIKDMESKVPELYWWKHAATCHHDSTLQSEGDYFEQDDVYTKLCSFEQP